MRGEDPCGGLFAVVSHLPYWLTTALSVLASNFFAFLFFFFFFSAHRMNDLTTKLENVAPFECDELEKHCCVSAKCYPTKVPALYTIAKETFNSLFLVLPSG